ncbi:MAG: metallophosphatase [Acidobacteria bacterium]|nr:metallophosphatase [Acidobacteriota bacterium]
MPDLQTIAPPRGRLIFIGDIHGCYDELRELLARLAPDAADEVISVGDMVRKGPDPRACVALWRSSGYRAVLGNNEERLFRRSRNPLTWITRSAEDRELLKYIATWPLAIAIPDAEIGVVHGGVLPGTALAEAEVKRQRATLPRLRWVRREGDRWRYVPKGEKSPGDVLWAKAWEGPMTIVYGHTMTDAPKRDPFALGIDTGCVYGGLLTAAIHHAGEWTFESVRAREVYVSGPSCAPAGRSSE